MRMIVALVCGVLTGACEGPPVSSEVEKSLTASAPTPPPTAQAAAARAAVKTYEQLPSCADPEIELRLRGQPREQIEARFGPPAEKKRYRAGEVGGEFYLAIEHTYPATDPKNEAVPIEEWTWKSGDCRLTVWFHSPRGAPEVLDDAFYDRRTQF
jgi:hypothetical protein